MAKKKKISKTKVGATLIGLSAILGTIGGYLSGSIDLVNAIQSLIVEIGGILAIYGIRDLPILNK